MRKKKILVTGGTGFLGKATVPVLRQLFEVDVLSRSQNSEIAGDLTHWNADLNISEIRKRQYDILLHMAGLYDLHASEEDCNKSNISTLSTALTIAQASDIPHFINTSSVAAAINSPLKSIKPYDLYLDKSFPDDYSRSKAFGEKLLQYRAESSGLSILNLRLGVLVGSTSHGTIDRLDGPYLAPQVIGKIRPLLLALKMKSMTLPGRYDTEIPVVPVDRMAKALADLCSWLLETARSGTYRSLHLTPEEGLGIEALYISTLRHLNIPIEKVTLVDFPNEKLLLKASHLLAKFPEREMHYILNFPRYESSETAQILGSKWCPKFRDYENTFWSGYEKYISHR